VWSFRFPLLLVENPGKKEVCQAHTVNVGKFVNEVKCGELVYKIIFIVGGLVESVVSM
jgi:hypothetical protein